MHFNNKAGCQILADDCYFVFLSLGFSVTSKQMEKNLKGQKIVTLVT